MKPYIYPEDSILLNPNQVLIRIDEGNTAYRDYVEDGVVELSKAQQEKDLKGYRYAFCRNQVHYGRIVRIGQSVSKALLNKKAWFKYNCSEAAISGDFFFQTKQQAKQYRVLKDRYDKMPDKVAERKYALMEKMDDFRNKHARECYILRYDDLAEVENVKRKVGRPKKVK